MKTCLPIAFALLLSACGSVPAAFRSPATCSGCCDANDTCQPGAQA